VTHTFLGEADITFFRPRVREYFNGTVSEIWVPADTNGARIGFLGLAEHSIDALFLDPAHRGRGAGCRLVAGTARNHADVHD